MKVLCYKATFQEESLLKKRDWELYSMDTNEAFMVMIQSHKPFDLVILFDDGMITLHDLYHVKQYLSSFILFFSCDYKRLYRVVGLVTAAYPRFLSESLADLYLKRFYVDSYLKKSVSIKGQDFYMEMPVNDIQYIEIYQRRCALHTVQGRVETSRFRFLNQMKRLDAFAFSNAGNSTYVNLHYVSHIHHSQVQTSFGKTFSLTRTYRQAFTHDYERYIHTFSNKS